MYVSATFVICLLCLVLITMHLQLDVCDHNFCDMFIMFGFDYNAFAARCM